MTLQPARRSLLRPPLGCGGIAGKAELLTGIEGASSPGSAERPALPRLPPLTIGFLPAGRGAIEAVGPRREE
jgi:hypothetical protein